MSGAHMTFFPKILSLLKERGAENISLIGGGVIPVEDIVVLKEMGVKELYPAGTPMKDIIEYVKGIKS